MRGFSAANRPVLAGPYTCVWCPGWELDAGKKETGHRRFVFAGQSLAALSYELIGKDGVRSARF